MTDLQVVGFTDSLLALNGLYRANDQTNHGRPVFQNVSTTNQDVLMYFWDESNGSELHGWWMAPEVGSQQAWATGPTNGELLPPMSGWKHPWNGPVDPKVKVMRVSSVKRPLEQEYAQQQPQRNYQQNEYQNTNSYPSQQQGYQHQYQGYHQGYQSNRWQNHGYGDQWYGQQYKGYDQKGKGKSGKYHYRPGIGYQIPGEPVSIPQVVPKQIEYKTDDSELVAAENAVVELGNVLKDEPLDLKKSLKSAQDAEPLMAAARQGIQGPNINPLWNTRVSKMTSQFMILQRQVAHSLRQKGDENVKKIKEMIEKARELSDKAQNDADSIDEAVKLYMEMVEFYDAQDKEMDELFTAPIEKPYEYAKVGPSIRKIRASLLQLGGAAAELPDRPETIEDVAEQIREGVRRNEMKTNEMVTWVQSAYAKICESFSVDELVGPLCDMREKFELVSATRTEQKAWIEENHAKVKDATRPETSAYIARLEVNRCRDMARPIDQLVVQFATAIKERTNALRLKIHDALALALREEHSLELNDEAALLEILDSIEKPVTTEKLLEKYEVPELQSLIEAKERGIELSREWSLPDFRDLIFPVYMLVRPTNITTSFEVKTARAIRKLKAGETVIQLGMPAKEEVGALRMKAASHDGQDVGYITYQGNVGTVFLKRHTGYFKVINEQGAVLRVKKTATKADEKAEDMADVKVEEKTEDMADEKVEEKTEDKADEKVEEKAADKADEKAADKADEKVEEKAADKADEKVEDKADDKADEKVEDKADDKVEDMTEEKVAANSEAKIDEKVETKIEEKADENVETKIEEKDTKKGEEKAEEDVMENVTLKKDQLLQAVSHPTVDPVANTASVMVRTLGDNPQEGIVNIRHGDFWFLELGLP